MNIAAQLCTRSAKSRRLSLQGFEPLELSQHAGLRLLRFPTFDAALDEYFSKVRGSKKLICGLFKCEVMKEEASLACVLFTMVAPFENAQQRTRKCL